MNYDKTHLRLAHVTHRVDATCSRNSPSAKNKPAFAMILN